jgi:two-component system, cell cycle sensor histidine kinase and response regulator CckA
MQDNPQSTEDHLSEAHLLVTAQMDELQQLYDQAPCGYHSLDANGVFVQINQTELTMLGYDRREILGQKRFTDLLTPVSQQIFATNFPVFKQQGFVQDLEFHLIRKNGDLLPVSLSTTAITNAAGNFVMSRSVVIDIRERKRLEAARQNSESLAHQRIVATWESMTDAYAALDCDWRFTYVNQAAIKAITYLTGIDPSTILTKTHWEVFPTLTNGIVEQRYRQSLAEQIPAHFEVLYEPTGNWFEIHAYPSAIGLGLYFRDITDRKASEQKIREQANLLAIATDAIFVHDLDNRVLFWNQGSERLYGWTEAAMLGQDWRNLLSPDTRSVIATVIEQGSWQGEVPKITQSGQKVVVMSRRSVMLDELGQPKSILTVDTDITEKKQLEMQFLRAQRLESLGTLASGIAHDLNNVLTPIIGIVQLLPKKSQMLMRRPYDCCKSSMIAPIAGRIWSSRFCPLPEDWRGNQPAPK